MSSGPERDDSNTKKKPDKEEIDKLIEEEKEAGSSKSPTISIIGQG